MQGLAQGCTLPSNLFQVFIDNTTVAVEAANQGVMMGEDKVSALMFAVDVVGILEAPEGLHKQTEKAFSRVHYR